MQEGDEIVAWRNRRLTAHVVFAVLLAMASGLAQAAVAVNKVELYEQQGRTGVMVVGDGQLTYRLVSQQDPPRVLVQLPEARVSQDILPSVTSQGLVRDIRVHKGNGSPYLELLLAGPAEAMANQEGTALDVALTPRGTEPDPAAKAAAANPQGSPKLRDYALEVADGASTLLLKTDKPVKRFQSFQLDEPAQLVVDLYDTAVGLPRNSYDLQHPFLDRLRLGEHGDRTRVVLDLKERVTHSLEPTDQGVEVVLRRPSAQEGYRQVKAVDFTVGSEPDIGRLELKMDRTGAEVQVHREKDKVVMDLPKTRLPEKLEKRLVVSDFGTVLETVDFYQKEDQVRVVASGQGPLEPTTYQLENKLVLDVAPKEAPEADKGPAATGEPYKGEKLSLNFQDIDVRQALNILAEFADLNIIAAESVSGSLTLRLQEVPWDQALDLILDSQGLGMERQGNVIRVAPQAELQKQREQELKSQLQKEQLVPLQTELIQVNYAKASAMKSLLESQGGGQGQGGMLSERGSISVDERTNNLMVRDTPSQIREIRNLVEELDRPTKQVMIEARIVKIDTSFERNLGIRWGGSYQNDSGTNAVSGTLGGAQAIGTGGGGQAEPSLAVDLPAAGVSGGGPSTLGFRLGSISNNATLDLELQAIEAEGEGKVISSPRVVTANQQEATIEQGSEIPYQQATSSGATSVSFKKATLSLEVTPQITPDGRLLMDVNAKNDSQGTNTVAGPTINTEEVETQVLVDDGETVVIGGIYAKTKREDETGVPLLRHIPLLGWLFRTQSTSTEKNELLIFLTPRIIEEGGPGTVGGRVQAGR